MIFSRAMLGSSSGNSVSAVRNVAGVVVWHNGYTTIHRSGICATGGDDTAPNLFNQRR